MSKPGRRYFWIQALLILSCVALIATAAPNKPPAKAPVKAPVKAPAAKAPAAKAPAQADAKQPPKEEAKEEPKAEEQPAEPDPNAEPTMQTAKTWTDAYSLPTEGYDIIAKLKPPPCNNLALPSALIPAVDMAGCMGKNVLKQIAPAYADNGADILGMGYVLAAGGKPSPETANSWFRLASKFQNGSMWQGLYKTCSIEVCGEPYIGITMATGMWVSGEYKPNQWASYKQYFARTCL